MTTNNRSNDTTKRIPAYTIYKPNRNETGGAVTFNFNPQKQSVFVEAANQSGDKRFDWEHKIIMKWGLPDLGTILAGMQERLPQSKLFHQTERANSACSLNYLGSDASRESDGGSPPFRFTISRQDGEDKSVAKVVISLTHGETAILATALGCAIGSILEW